MQIRRPKPLAIHRPRDKAAFNSRQVRPDSGRPRLQDLLAGLLPSPAGRHAPSLCPSISAIPVHIPTPFHLAVGMTPLLALASVLHCGWISVKAPYRADLNQIMHPLSTFFVVPRVPACLSTLIRLNLDKRCKSGSCVTVPELRRDREPGMIRVQKCNANQSLRLIRTTCGSTQSDQLSPSGRFAHLANQFPPIASLGTSRADSPTGTLQLSGSRATADAALAARGRRARGLHPRIHPGHESRRGHGQPAA